MEHNSDITIHDRREMDKFGLDTFPRDCVTDFDYEIDKLIEELKSRNKKSWEEHDSWLELEQNNPERYNELKEKADQYEVSLDLQRYGYIEDIIFNDDQLTVLSEMKIIYAYKQFEIKIKKLLRASLSADTDQFYKWATLVQFLKGKNIIVSSLEGHSEVIELQTVNNSLKHTDEVSNKITAIREFRSTKKMSHVELDKFYSRIKEFPQVFISSLTNALYTELYEFSEDKLQSIANSFVLRMDRDTALKLIDKISKSY